jgi:hypothetical protein
MTAAAIGSVVAGGFAVACGSSDTGADGNDDDAGPGTFGGDSGDPPDDEQPDGGIFMSHADAGCPVKYAGPNPGTIAQSIPRSGVTTGKAWSNPSGGLKVDGQFAEAPLGVGEQTELLRVTGYGFKIPSNVSIKGVVVQLKRQGGTTVVDGNIELWLDGVASDRPKFIASGWPSKIGTHHYGQEVDTWGNDLTPALINQPGFGSEIWAKRREDAGATGTALADIESLIVTIWYCE